MCNFSACDFLHEYGLVSVSFSSVRTIEMIDSIA